MARNKYPGVCYCCSTQVPIGYGHFEKVRGGRPSWRIKCVKCASGRVLNNTDPGVQKAIKDSGAGGNKRLK